MTSLLIADPGSSRRSQTRAVQGQLGEPFAVRAFCIAMGVSIAEFVAAFGAEIAASG